MKYTRKSFLQLIGAGLLATGTAVRCTANTNTTEEEAAPLDASNAFNLKLGLASYTLREFSLDEVIAMVKRVQLPHLCLKSMHMPLDASVADIEAAAKKVRDAGLDLYGAGVIYMKSADEVNNAFAYAKAAGLKVIVGVPNYDLLPLVEQKVKETDIKLAIHNHGPGDDVYPSPDSVMEKVKDLDPRIGLCMDIGHTVRIGEDPSEKARKYADRLYDVHIKDVNKATSEGTPVEIGRGLIDIPKFLRTLQDIQYQSIVGFEYEKDGKDPLAGLAESVGYVKGVMVGMTA